jgi:hypothetical protein
MKKGLAGLFEFFDLRIKDRFCAEVTAPRSREAKK